MEITPTLLGERLKQLIREREMTPAEFASSLGVSRTSTHYWLSGRNYPTLNALVQIAELLEISLDELVGRERWQRCCIPSGE